MSAAAPPPPPHRSSLIATAGESNGGSVSKERVFAHILDLQAQASSGYSPTSSIRTLLDTAEQAQRQSTGFVNARRPDFAYVEFIRSNELAAVVIPKHAGYIDFTHDDKNGEQRLGVLRRKLTAEHERFMNIKTIIEYNNERHGTLAKSRPASSNGSRRTSAANGQANGSHPGPLLPSKEKPPPSPKPQALHGRAISTPPGVLSPTNGVAQDALMNRFSKLRMNGDHASKRSSISSIQTSPETLSTPSHLDLSISNMSDSPSNAFNAPLRPAKLPLDTSISVAMPKAPSPTYSPARNMDTNGSIAPPRYSARSLAASEIRKSTLSSAYSPAQTEPPSFPIQEQESDAILGSTAPRRKPTHNLDDLQISAERLYDFLKLYHVLLIDARSRDEFDRGHIFTRNIMCMEPMTLRQGMSAEQVMETLVISPEAEQSMWEGRDKFDLVVYYDQGTTSDTFLQQPRSDDEAKLKYLHEALWDFNQERPLQTTPKVLVGGLDAWCDIVGSQSLAVSSTVNRKPKAQLQRRPLASSGARSELKIPRRRLRDYNPLDKEEEQRWMERARQESISAPQPPLIEDRDLGAAAGEIDGEETGNAAIEEFLQRFPDAGQIDRQPGFMSGQVPARAPPLPPAKIPDYPPRPPPSRHPQVPARPLPAAPRMSYNGVSDRAAPPLPRTSSSLAPYIPPRYMASNVRLPRTGLVNFGVTCYMNATLQALSATTPLSQFFLDDDFRKKVQADNWKGSKGVMPELYSNVIRNLWQAGGVESIKPTTFRTFCGRLNREWSIDRQQDAKEFFDFLVDCLHEDLNSNWSETPLKALTAAEEQRRESMPKHVVSKIEWDRYTHRESSYLTQLFGGQHASRLRCTTCGFTSTTYEAFYSVSVEIPRPRNSNGRVSLDECLTSYCAEEMLSGDEVWKCPHCRREREATKQITITRAPQYLVVHFKRFAAGHSTSARKVRTLIDFPLQGLDLEPYMLPQQTSEQAQINATKYGNQHLKSELSTRPPFVYDAYAVMRHIGTTLSSGHYTCAVNDRIRGSWRMFNDTRVNDFQPADLDRNAALCNEEAYIVFYVRRAA